MPSTIPAAAAPHLLPGAAPAAGGRCPTSDQRRRPGCDDATMTEYPRLLHTVLDTTDARGLAEFYRQLLGLQYRPGDEPPAGGPDEDTGWLVLLDAAGARVLAFQQVERLEPTTWPEHDVPMQLHLDFTVSGVEELHRQRRRAEALGARLALDRAADPQEPLYVFRDPSGHPFCIFVA